MSTPEVLPDPAAPQPAAASLPVEVEVVRAAVNRLGMLAATLRGASSGEPESIASAFADGLAGPLQRDVPPVIIEVEAECFRYAGAEVGGGDLVMARLIEGLYRQGLRALTLLPWVTREELIELTALLCRDWLEDPGSGLEALAWQRNLYRVHFEIGTRGLITEADGEVRTVELVRRLLQQLGLDQGSLEGGVAVEVGAMMAVLRRTEEQGMPDVGARGSSTGSVHVVRELRQLEAGQDVALADASRLVFGTAQAATTDAEATELVRAGVRHVQRRLAAGTPEAAGSLLRRWLLLLEPDLPLSPERRTAVRTGLRDATNEASLVAVQRGWEQAPDPVLWRGPIFSLSRCATLEDLPQLVRIGRCLPSGPLHQAIADALILVAEREQVGLRGLLLHADQAQLPFVLRMVRRSTDATLVEPVLARMSNEDPAVREAVLVSLRGHRSRRIGEVARQHITDPHRGVRIEALRYISVYRDGQAVPALLERLDQADESIDFAELRAVALATLHSSGGGAISALESFAAQEGAGRHPRAAEAAMEALKAGGASGREALDRLARTHARLRSTVRAVLGGGQ
jgi:hypothetical protein